MPDQPVLLDGSSLTIQQVIDVARNRREVKIPAKTMALIKANNELLKDIVRKGKRCYGITTGLGPLSEKRLSREEARELQKNMVLSHACAVGDPLPTDVVRATLLLRANALAKGRSGVRPELVNMLVEMLNRGIHPIVPSRGSVGASGDLAPLAHIALVIAGLPGGKAEINGEIMDGAKALEAAGLKPLELDHKEGLALINGVSVTTAVLALAVHDALVLAKTADICLAMTLEAVGGFLEPFDEEYLNQRNVFPLSGGHLSCARNVRRMVEGSRLLHDAHRKRAHDPYSIRCAPQIHGAVREGLAFTERVVSAALNSIDDNPLFFEKEPCCRSGGNFHGQPLALAADVLSISMSVLGNTSERRTALLMNSYLSEVLPDFLIWPGIRPGLNSGLMLTQYVAASLASENRIYACPAGIGTIPTSANFEDVVSMSLTAALKARRIVENLTYVLAIELMCAAQALSIRGAEKAGDGTKAVYEILEDHGIVPIIQDDVLYWRIDEIAELIRNGEVLKIAEEKIGKIC